MRRGIRTVFVVAVLATAAVAVGWMLYLRPWRLPYQDSFERNQAAEWTPYGGQWQMRNGTVVNRSDEDGAKLVAGDLKWKNYALDTDLKLVGQGGNAGVMVRVNGEEQGTDSYNGYYVGLRTDSTFVAGRADHGWLAGRLTIVRGGVQTGTWYHLRVVVVGCRLAAEATNLQTGDVSDLVSEEHPCVPMGRIGLRSMGMGGAWRHVRVTPATEAQLNEIAARASFMTHLVYPLREDEFNRMMEELAKENPVPPSPFLSVYAGDANARQPTPIASGKAAATLNETVTFRGVVTLTSPVYIQDESGGIEVRTAHDFDLNLGDEIQVEGTVVPSAVSPYLHADDLRVVSERTPVAAIAVTAAQLADGSFDGRLVELNGTLVARSIAGDAVRLRMSDGEEDFAGVVRGLLAPGQLQQWAVGSQLRIRGICTIGPGQQGKSDAFTILLRSVDDVEVLRGPPWWTPHLIVRYILAILLLSALGVYIYLRTERNKMRAILEERERLAHEMHDTLAQSFAGVGFQLQGVRNSLRSGSLALPAVLEKLDTACRMVTHTHREASAEIAALHPGAADEAPDLLTALERMTHGMVEEHMPPIRLVREGTPRIVTLAIRDAMFQVGRESIANILRHSSATEIVLRLCYEPRHLLLEVRDNGCGFQYEDHAGEFGIRGMRRRMERVGGTLTIVTAPGEGVAVSARVVCGRRFWHARLVSGLRSRNANV